MPQIHDYPLASSVSNTDELIIQPVAGATKRVSASILSDFMGTPGAGIWTESAGTVSLATPTDNALIKGILATGNDASIDITGPYGSNAILSAVSLRESVTTQPAGDTVAIFSSSLIKFNNTADLNTTFAFYGHEIDMLVPAGNTHDLSPLWCLTGGVVFYGSGNTSYANGVNGYVDCGDGSIDVASGTIGYIGLSGGHIGLAYALEANIVCSAGSADSVFGLYIKPEGSGATITNLHGIWCDEIAQGTNKYYSWFDSRGVYRIKEDATHDSVGQAVVAHYNPLVAKYTPGATDFERFTGYWDGNTYSLGVEKGGTGTLRPLALIGASLTFANDTGLGTAALSSSFLALAAGTTAKSQINLAASTAPTSPNNGDVWFDGSNLKIRVGGATKTFTIT